MWFPGGGCKGAKLNWGAVQMFSLCVCVCVLSLYVEDPKVGVGAVIWAEGKQVSQKHIKLDWVYKRILNKEHLSDFLLKLPLVTMWWHRSALPCGLWVQRLPSGLTVRGVSSDGSQARGETEQEVQIHAPCGAERAHIQVTRGNEQSRQKNNNSSSAHAGDVLGLNALTICAELWISGHSNVQINSYWLVSPFVSRQSAGAQRSKKRRTRWFLWPNARVTSVFLSSAALE